MTALPVVMAGPVQATAGPVRQVALDLAFGPTLPWLQLRRWYNSHDTGPGPFGPGWSSWASTRLVVAGAQRSVVHWRGPDGTVASARVGDHLPGGAQVIGTPPELVFPADGTRWRFDPGGRPVLLDPGPGDRVALGWEDDRLVGMRHERGRVLVFAWVGDRIVSAETDDGRCAVFTYDGRGRLIAVEAPAGLERYEWDDRDQLVAVVDADGVVRDPGCGEPADLLTRRLPTRIDDPEGGVTVLDLGIDGLPRRITDPDGVGIGLTHDTQGRLIAVTDAFGHARRFEWAPGGQLAAEITPLGLRTAYEHDPAGRVTTRTLPDGSVERTTYSPGGRVLARVDAEGGITRWAYDGDGRPITEVGPEGEAWAYAYDPDHHLVAVTDPRGGVWHDERDAGGRPVGLTTPDGDHRALPLDPDGRLLGTAALCFGYDLAGRLDGCARPDDTTSGATYDRAGRVTSVTSAGGRTTRFAYSPGGRLTAVVDPLGAVTALRYDAGGRLAEVVDPAGGRTRWRYDPDGHVVQTTDPTGDKTRYGYDAGGRLVQETAPHGGVTRYSYDRVGRLTTITDPTGAVVSCSYDQAGRVTTVVDANGGIVTYAYDAAGHVVAATDPLGSTTTYGFDAVGRLVAATDACGRTIPLPADRDVEADGADVTRRRDADGLLLEEAAPTSHQAWAYDLAGRVVAHTVALPDRAPVTTRYDRDACGRIVAVHDPELGTTTVERDAAGRPVEIRTRHVTDVHLWFDGLLIARERTVGAITEVVRYSRDAAGRIVGTVDGEERLARFAYDPAGQLTSVELPDRLWRFAWDACGRLAHEDTPTGRRRYSYDPAGRLTAITTPTRLARLTWDGDGRRLTEAAASAIRRYDWDEAGQLLAIRSIGDPERAGAAVELRYDTAGRLGAVDGVPLAWDDTAGARRLAVVGDRRLGADALLGSTGPPGLDLVGADPFGLPQRDEVAADSLRWRRDRLYDPATRSFVSRDPRPRRLGHPATSNPYGDAANDPVNDLGPPAVELTACDGEATWRRAVVASLVAPSGPEIAGAGWPAFPGLAADIGPHLLDRALQGHDPFDTHALLGLLGALPTPPTPTIKTAPAARTPGAAAGGWPGGAA